MKDEPAPYRIGFYGQLDATWADWFANMSLNITYDQGASLTILTGVVKDQAALHGLLARIRDLGLILTFVERSKPPTPAPVEMVVFKFFPNGRTSSGP